MEGDVAQNKYILFNKHPNFGGKNNSQDYFMEEKNKNPLNVAVKWVLWRISERSAAAVEPMTSCLPCKK